MKTYAPARMENPFAAGHPKTIVAKIWHKIRGFLWYVRSIFIAFLAFIYPFLLSYQLANAATLPYSASVSPASVTIAAGQSKQITLKFTNTGAQTWASGASKTAVYLYGSSSIFGHPSWVKDDLPALIAQPTVKPGQVASATFWIKAPNITGTFTEKFLLSSGPGQWIKGSTLSVTINVTGAAASAPAPAPVTPAVAPPASLSTASSEWKATLTDRGGLEWQLDPEAHTILTLAFKNTGSKTWTRDGANYVSLYTGTNNRKSPFKDMSWKSDVQSVSLKEATVRPNETGHFVLELRAPQVPGDYQESFQLAAENAAWISGGTVTLPIRVSMTRDYIAKGIPNGVSIADVQPSQTGFYQAQLLLKSATNVKLSGNARQPLTFGFKNAGTAVWNTISLRLASVVPSLGKLSNVRDESWPSSLEPVKTQKATAPGEIGFLGFTIKVPPKKGTYTAVFKLYADEQPVLDGDINIPITVTADGYIEPDPVPVPPTAPLPSSSPPAPSPVVTAPISGDLSSLPSEPIIRVGLFATTDNQMMLRAVSGGFKLQQNGSAICTFTGGEVVTVAFDRANKVYKATGPRCTTQSTSLYVAVADDGLAPLELTDFSRPVSWLPGANDNKFRGKLELRYTPSTDSVWIINELPIEWYLKGIGETSNSSPQEYQRALLTAARTYAMYHVQHASKHADESYIVDATYDQVYRGYGAEARDPAVVSAVNATRGQIVTYNGVLAITPYYSRSDGRTRAWTEVWGGAAKPWLVSVQVPWDNGKTLWGHGVGLSATGALGMAADGKTYDQILKWFYTGIELRLAYK